MKRWVIGICLLVMLGIGCKREPSTEAAKTESVVELAALRFRDDTPHLLLTWLDEQGNGHIETSPAMVPEKARAFVRVLMTDKAERLVQLQDQILVADLTKKTEGYYEPRLMPRTEWEQLLKTRREASARLRQTPEPNAAQPGADPPADSGQGRTAPPSSLSGVSAIIYGAEWCGPCHQAQAYLEKRGVSVVKKDVEESPDASKELRAKLEKAGKRGGSIPVIDIRGQILVGFNPEAIERALVQAKPQGTLL